MAVTRGLDILVYVGDQLIGGQRDAELSMSADSIDVSSKENFGWSSVIGGSKSWEITTSGNFISDDAGQALLLEAFVNAENVTVEMKNEDGTVKFSGLAQVTDISISATYDDICQIDATFSGVGALQLKDEA